MKMQLQRLGKPALKTNSLVSPSLFDGVWKIGETKDIEDSKGYKIMGKYGDMFKIVPDGEPAEDKQFNLETGKKVVDTVSTTEGRRRGRPPTSKG